MKPQLFARLWNAFWPSPAMMMTPEKLGIAWGPSIGKLDDADVAAFVNGWARENVFPPSLHELLLGVGAVTPKAIVTSPTPTVKYPCTHCDAVLTGWIAFRKHDDEEHEDQRVETSVVDDLIEDWRKKRAPVLDLTGDTDESASDGTPVTGEEDATDSSATNGMDDQDEPEVAPPPETEPADPMESALAEGRKPTDEERAQLMETQAGLPVGGDPELVPNTDNAPLDDTEAWELASRNLRDHDGHRVTAKASVQPCTVCDVFAIGLVFRPAPVDVQAAGVTKGDTMAGRCWGCVNIGRSDRFGMPIPTQKTRSAWRRLSNLVAPKGWKKPDRARWINTALGNTREMLRVRADVRPEPEDTSESCGTCGDSDGGSRLLFGVTDEAYEEVYAALCWDCGGSPLYSSPRGQWSGIPPAAKGESWYAYGDLFTEDLDRTLAVSEAVQRTKAVQEWPPELLTLDVSQGDTERDGVGESVGVGMPKALPEGSGKASDDEFDTELPI